MSHNTSKKELSYSINGNQKLGKKISVLSRAVDDSCPNSCNFLDQNCYAQKTEKRFSAARKAGLKNIQIQDWQKIRSFLLDAKKRGNAIRLHERGDFLKTNAVGAKILDRKYINNLTRAIKSIDNPPQIFFYSHVYRKEVAKLSKLGISCFASVSTTADYKAAKKVGFKKFAWSTSLRKGVDKNKIWTTETGHKVPVCWEQIGKGKKKNTCDECEYCIKNHLGSIAFMNH